MCTWPEIEDKRQRSCHCAWLKIGGSEGYEG